MLTVARLTCIVGAVAVYALALATGADGEYGAAVVMVACGFGLWLYGCSDSLADTIDADRQPGPTPDRQ